MHMFTKHGPAMPLSENLGYIYHTTVGFGWTGFNATPLKKYMMRELQAWFAEPQLYEVMFVLAQQGRGEEKNQVNKHRFRSRVQVALSVSEDGRASWKYMTQ